MSQEIVAALVGFFSGRRGLADLREALARQTLNLAVRGSQEERDFVGELELALAEYEAGHIGFDEFAARISPRINGLVLISPAAEIRTQAQAVLCRQQQWTVGANIPPSGQLLSVQPRTV